MCGNNGSVWLRFVCPYHGHQGPLLPSKGKNKGGYIGKDRKFSKGLFGRTRASGGFGDGY